MPQTSEELRGKMKYLFGNSIDERGPTDFLLAAGYILTKKYTWLPKAGVNSYDDMTQKEYDCMKFLIDEWDYAGLELPETSEQ